MGASKRLGNVTVLFPDTTFSTTLTKSSEVKHHLVFPPGTSPWNSHRSALVILSISATLKIFPSQLSGSQNLANLKSTIFSCNLRVIWEWRLNLKKQDEVEYVGVRGTGNNYRIFFSCISQNLFDGHFYSLSKTIQWVIQIWITYFILEIIFQVDRKQKTKLSLYKEKWLVITF